MEEPVKRMPQIVDTVIAPNMKDQGMKTLLTREVPRKKARHEYEDDFMAYSKPLRRTLFHESDIAKKYMEKLEEDIRVLKDALVKLEDIYDIAIVQGKIRGYETCLLYFKVLEPPLSDVAATQEQLAAKQAAEVKRWV